MNTRSINAIIAMIDEQGSSPEEDAEDANQLQLNGHPTEITSVDGREHLLPRHIISGVRFFTDFKDTECTDRDFLNMACDCALHEAIVTRIQLNCDTFKFSNLDDDEKLLAKEKLLDDCMRLGNLFWSAGFAFSCRVMLNLGNYYSNSSEDGAGALARVFHEEAIKHYHRAMWLSDKEPSIKMFEIIYKNGLAGLGWKNYDEVKADVFASNLGDTRNKYLRLQVEKEMADLFHKDKDDVLALRN